MELVGSGLTLRQVAAWEAQAKAGDRDAIVALDRALEDERVRWSAREALGRVGPAVVPVLIASLEQPTREAGRARVELLGKLGESAAAPALIAALASDDLRWSASEALVKLGSSIVPLLVPVLEDPERGWLVVRILSQLGELAALPALLAALREGDRLLHEEAARALETWANAQSTVHLREALPLLKRLRRNLWERGSWAVYQTALDAIESATENLKDIPLTAPAPGSSRGLPIPTEERFS